MQFQFKKTKFAFKLKYDLYFENWTTLIAKSSWHERL